MKPLTARQLRFVGTYSGNATVAAIQAGYSPKTARSQGQRLLTNVDIQKAIQAREKTRMESTIANRKQRQEFRCQGKLDRSGVLAGKIKTNGPKD